MKMKLLRIGGLSVLLVVVGWGIHTLITEHVKPMDTEAHNVSITN